MSTKILTSKFTSLTSVPGLDLGGMNFQSGFGNLNDAADSIGSLFGFGPEDRDVRLSRSQEEHITPLYEYIEGKTKSLTAANSGLILSKIDLFINFYMRCTGDPKWKSSNTKAAQKQELEAYQSALNTLRNKYKADFTLKSATEPSYTDSLFNGSTQTKSNVKYNTYTLKSSSKSKFSALSIAAQPVATNTASVFGTSVQSAIQNPVYGQMSPVQNEIPDTPNGKTEDSKVLLYGGLGLGLILLLKTLKII
jgi:hypothetical protein